MDNPDYSQEVRWAWGAVLAGALLAVVIWRGQDMMNFVYTWVPQVVALGAMLLIKARPAAVAGAACGFAGYLLFFRWLAATYYIDNGLVWLLYLFSLPGGFVGAIVATTWLHKREHWSANAAALAAAAFVLVGIAINDAFVRAVT